MNANLITIAPAFPLWLIIIVFCLGLAFVFAQYRVTRNKLGKRRAFLISSHLSS